MNYFEYVTSISFRFIQPSTRLFRGYNPFARLLEKFGVSLEIMNTQLPEKQVYTERVLAELCKIPKMSTFAIGAMINRAVSQMPDDCVFLNIGVWNGFTFLSGLVGNPQKKCIGVDNFSEFGGPRQVFINRFKKFKDSRHRFYDIDYVEYFSKIHNEPIGCYIYDGNHNYENQLRGLQNAEPYLAQGCILFVDDTNANDPRQATLDFIAQRSGNYEILMNQTTRSNCHPTYWNGLMILQKIK